jgi:cysteine desulfurase
VDSIYLDNNSTTRADPRVIEAMSPFWRDCHGNPSSMHLAGQAARHAVETAREQVAALIGAKPREIVFTSGGTESDNLAILGTLGVHPARRRIITTSVEHVAVHSLCERLAKRGHSVVFLAVSTDGALDIDALATAIDDNTALVSVMYANNETGVIFPIRQVSEICARHRIPLHVDAVQAAGKTPFRAPDLGAQLVSISAHKIHGPKGVGALYVGKGARLESVLVGGHQERDIRPGTENVPAIVGFGVAAQLAAERLHTGAMTRVAELRDRLETGVLQSTESTSIIGQRGSRIPNTTLIGFEALEAEAILISLSEGGVCASSGSACSSGSLEPSHVLKAMGIPEHIAHGAVRFSLSHETAVQEIDRAVEVIARVSTRLRGLTSVV